MIAENKVLTSAVVVSPDGIKPLAVMDWELRRLGANRSSWVVAGTALGCLMGILLVRHDWGMADSLVLFGTSAYGQLCELVYELMIVFGIILPFLATDAVAHDYKQRMHELLMTAAVPTRVYIWGRFMASLLVSLGLAVVLLFAQLGMNLILSATDPILPAPNPAVTLTYWGLIVLPATTLLTGLGFTFGTLFPRYTIVPKLAMCIAWTILAFDTDPTDLGWRAYWNPTGAGLATILTDQLRQAVQTALQSISSVAQQVQAGLQMQQQMPDLRPWLGPYLVWAIIGILLIVVAAAGFRRFRDVMS